MPNSLFLCTVLALSVLVVSFGPAAVSAATFVTNFNDDLPDLQPGDGI